MATTTVDLEQEDVVLDSVAAAAEEASSDLKSLESLRLHDLTEQQIQTIAASGDFATLHRRNMEVGCVVMGFHRFIKDHAPLVIAMRNIMRPRRGSKKRTDVDGVMMTWGEYCLKFYGVGHDWVNRMLKGEHTQDTPEVEDMDEESVDATEGVEQTESKKPSRKVIEKDIINLNKRLDEAHAEMAEKDEEIDKLRLQCAAQKHDAQVEEEKQNQDYDPDFDAFSFVLDYFQPITKPLSFFSEIDRLIRACKMQEHGKTVLNELAGAAASQEAL
jgi:hypothetical protein